MIEVSAFFKYLINSELLDFKISENLDELELKSSEDSDLNPLTQEQYLVSNLQAMPTKFFRETLVFSSENYNLEKQIRNRNLATYKERAERNLDLWTGDKV